MKHEMILFQPEMETDQRLHLVTARAVLFRIGLSLFRDETCFSYRLALAQGRDLAREYLQARILAALQRAGAMIHLLANKILEIPGYILYNIYIIGYNLLRYHDWPG
jgi:hypothetical protein